jgi:hypothetical protein
MTWFIWRSARAQPTFPRRRHEQNEMNIEKAPTAMTRRRINPLTLDRPCISSCNRILFLVVFALRTFLHSMRRSWKHENLLNEKHHKRWKLETGNCNVECGTNCSAIGHQASWEEYLWIKEGKTWMSLGGRPPCLKKTGFPRANLVEETHGSGVTLGLIFRSIWKNGFLKKRLRKYLIET